MILFGVTGAIGHGKSSFAEALMNVEPKSRHLESSYVIAEVADQLHAKLSAIPESDDFDAINQWLAELPPIVQRVTHTAADINNLKITRQAVADSPVDYDKLFVHLDNLRSNPALVKSEISDENKSLYRPILQWLGGYLVKKIDAGIWWNELIRRANQAGADGDALVVLGGVRYPADADIVRAAGGTIISVIRPDIPVSDIKDPTERERQKIIPDVVVHNNGDLNDLNNCARNLYQDSLRGSPKPEYFAKPE